MDIGQLCVGRSPLLRRRRAWLASRPGLAALATVWLLATTQRLVQAQQHFLRDTDPDTQASLDAGRAELKHVIYMTQIVDDDREIDRRLYQNLHTMSRTFAALPKNTYGRLSKPSASYMIQRFFAGTHGWIITGLELGFKRAKPINATFTDVEIAGAMAVAGLQNAYESRQHGLGLSAVDMASMALALDLMCASDTREMLERAYDLTSEMKEIDTSATSSSPVMHQILILFSAIMGLAPREHRLGDELHKEGSEEANEEWDADVAAGRILASEVRRAFGFRKRHVANPFMKPRYAYIDAVQMATHLVMLAGTWHNEQCQVRKQELISLDPQRTGTVALSGFYMQSSGRRFVESVEYLRATGGLEEHSDRGPRVRVANYLLSPGRCTYATVVSSLCCVNECDALMAELEDFVRAPAAKPELLLAFVGANLSSHTVAAPRPLPEHLVRELQSIAVRHNGEVPLYGRLFAQWLHVAFPYECPFPHVPENEADARQGHWANIDYNAPPKERARLAEGWSLEAEASAVRHVSAFDDWEQLPLADPEDHRSAKAWKDLALVVAMPLVIFATVAHTTFGLMSRPSTAMLGFVHAEKGPHLA